MIYCESYPFFSVAKRRLHILWSNTFCASFRKALPFLWLFNSYCNFTRNHGKSWAYRK